MPSLGASDHRLLPLLNRHTLREPVMDGKVAQRSLSTKSWTFTHIMSSFLFGLRKEFLPFHAIAVDMTRTLRLRSMRLAGRSNSRRNGIASGYGANFVIMY